MQLCLMSLPVWEQKISKQNIPEGEQEREGQKKEDDLSKFR